MGMKEWWSGQEANPGRAGAKESDAQAEAYLQELIATYPTPESIVDDYRNNVISPLAMPRRFPDAKDQELVERLVKERIAADRNDQADFRAVHVTPVLDAALKLDPETVARIVGEDDWEINEFDAKLEAALHDRTDEENLAKMAQILTEMKTLADSEDPAKDVKLGELADAFNVLS